MLQILKEPNLDFMGKRALLVSISALLVLASIVVLFTKRVDRGVEFTGGTELQVRYRETPRVGDIRAALSRAGLASQSVTTIGDPAENEVYIRLGIQGGVDDPDPTSVALAALHEGFEQQTANRIDINLVDQETLARLVRELPEVSTSTAEALAAVVLEARKERAIFHELDDLAELPGMTPEILKFLGDRAFAGPLALRSQSFVGPAIGRELMNKALFAIVGSLVGMLIYIWIRFQLQWGFAAVVALAHDSLITLGLFALFDQEMSLPVVAAFLTLVGYSVNDTVVVFDRIRENLRLKRGAQLADIVNHSINQTLSRTVITSGLTWIVVFGLYLFGGAALRPFSFVLTVGVLVGTYSSIFIASPILVWWKQFTDRRNASETPPVQAPRRGRKVRRRSTG